MHGITQFTTSGTAPLDTIQLPMDPALPGYAFLSERSQLRANLGFHLAQWLGPDARLLDARAFLCRLVPLKRCTVELHVTIGHRDGTAEQRRLAAKVYNGDKDTSVYRVLTDLRQHGLGAGRFKVPQPVAHVPEHRLLVLTWTEGESIKSLLSAGIDISREITEGAKWLLCLHDCGVNSGRQYSFNAHLHTLNTWKELLSEIYPKGESLMASLLARFEERGRDLTGWISGPTHRDFTPEHLVLHGDHVTCLDFDEFCQYDQLFDVAHFTAHLRFLGLAQFGGLNHFDRFVNLFQATYEAGTTKFSEERVRFYTAISYFKLARFVALIDRHNKGRQLLPELLKEARRLV